MERVRIETIVQPNGRIVIDDLPFDAGKTVEVVVSEGKNGKHDEADSYPLRGKTPYRYDDPFSPLISPDDWKPFE